MTLGVGLSGCGFEAFRLASRPVSTPADGSTTGTRTANRADRRRITALYEAIAKDLEDLRTTGRVRAADALSAATGQHFNAAVVPHYFTGDVDARFVLVHLNAKQVDNFDPAYTGPVPTLDAYVDAHAHFGRDNYGPTSPRTHRSPFDYKQIRFLQAFGSIDFVPDDAPDARFVNLERVSDKKLQLEAVPYGSTNFAVPRRRASALAPHFARLLDVIAAAHRDYVIFCGSVFLPLLADSITAKHTFRLKKVDGSTSRGEASFYNLAIRHSGRTITAGIAATYAQQGIPMRSYAEECAARY